MYSGDTKPQHETIAYTIVRFNGLNLFVDVYFSMVNIFTSMLVK